MKFFESFRIYFSIERGRTIKEVFYESLNFRWEQSNHDFLWSRSHN